MKVSQLILWTACWLVGAITCKAQPTSKFRFGLVGGVNAGQINTPLLKSTTGLLWRYDVGVTMKQQFSSRFSIIYQVKYARLGDKGKTTGIGGNDFNISEFNYVTLPVMGQFGLKGKRASLKVGGQMGYFLSGRNYFASKKEQALSIQNMTKLDAGLVGGLGYQFGKHIAIDAHYYYGLRKIRKDLTAPDPITGIPTVIKFVPQYNRAWSLDLSYYF